MITRDILARLWPHAPAAKLDAIVATAPDVFRAYGITTPLRVAHFMAQVSHENGAGTIVRESGNYSAPRLSQIFGWNPVKQKWNHSARVTDAEALALAHNGPAIFERVYGLGNPPKARELGNTQPGDGNRYCGNGDLQLTGRGAHRRIGQLIGVDLEGDPEQLQDPAISFRCAAAEFAALKCLPPADADDVVLVTRRVNGGRNGLPERTAWLKRWKIALPELPDQEPAPDEPQQAPRQAEETPAKTLGQSNIVKGAAGAAAATAPPIAGAVINAADGADPATPVTETITNVINHAGDVIATTRTVIDVAPPVPPSLWKIAAHFLTDPVVLIGFGVIALAAIGYVIWERRRKLREEGV